MANQQGSKSPVIVTAKNAIVYRILSFPSWFFQLNIGEDKKTPTAPPLPKDDKKPS